MLFIQANMRKSRETTHSFFHDPDFKQASFLLLTEPYAILNDQGHPSSSSVPNYHSQWQPYYLSSFSQTSPKPKQKAPFRAMIWAAKRHHIQPVLIDNSDITALILTLPSRKIFIISMYIPCSTGRSQDKPKLKLRLELVKSAYSKLQNLMPDLELTVGGDFHRWDTLWGGDHLASHPRQGKGRSILEFMTDLDLQLLLPRGTSTYTGNSQGGVSTIHLTMVSSRLFSEQILCQTHQTEHGSDHLAIVNEFMTEAPDVTPPPRRAYKNARWDVLNLEVMNQLSRIEKIDPITNLEEYTTELINIVLEGIEKSVPLAKRSPYNKRWWTEDLSQLRKRYTLFRNQARRQRRCYGSEFARPQYNSAQVASFGLTETKKAALG